MSLARAITRFFGNDAAGGLLLMASALLALFVANSGFAPFYETFLSAKLSLTLDGNGLTKPLILWINDGLMAIFFFLIGLELKREILEGKLKEPRDIVLPGLAAIGGMAVPALVFAAFNWNSPETLGGWAIPHVRGGLSSICRAGRSAAGATGWAAGLVASGCHERRSGRD